MEGARQVDIMSYWPVYNHSAGTQTLNLTIETFHLITFVFFLLFFHPASSVRQHRIGVPTGDGQPRPRRGLSTWSDQQSVRLAAANRRHRRNLQWSVSHTKEEEKKILEEGVFL